MREPSRLYTSLSLFWSARAEVLAAGDLRDPAQRAPVGRYAHVARGAEPVRQRDGRRARAERHRVDRHAQLPRAPRDLERLRARWSSSRRTAARSPRAARGGGCSPCRCDRALVLLDHRLQCGQRGLERRPDRRAALRPAASRCRLCTGSRSLVGGTSSWATLLNVTRPSRNLSGTASSNPFAGVARGVQAVGRHVGRLHRARGVGRQHHRRLLLGDVDVHVRPRDRDRRARRARAGTGSAGGGAASRATRSRRCRAGRGW